MRPYWAHFFILVKRRKTMKKIIGLLKAQAKLVCAAGVIVVFVVGFVIFINRDAPTITASSVIGMDYIQELASVECDCEAVATVYDEQKKEKALKEENAEKREKKLTEAIKYHVLYKGIVKAGIKNIDEIKTEIDKENKKIIVTLPEIEIIGTSVDENLKQMQISGKYNEKTVLKEALEACEEDLNNRIKDGKIKEVAKESAAEIIKAAFEPFAKELGKKYSVEVR